MRKRTLFYPIQMVGKRSLFCVCLFTHVCMFGAYAQPPDSAWTRFWQRPGIDLTWDVAAANDDGFILTGTNIDDGIESAFLLRFNSDGDTLWRRHYFGAEFHSSMSVVQANDGDFLAAGGGAHPSMIRTDSMGEIRWIREYEFPSMPTLADIGKLRLVPEGGFIAKTARGMTLIRFDDGGDTLWTRGYNAQTAPLGGGLSLTLNSGFYLSVSRQSPGSPWLSAYVAKTTRLGEVQWAREYQLPHTSQEQSLWVQDIVTAQDGGAALVGFSESLPEESADIFVVRIDSNGDTLWTYSFGEPGIDETAYGIASTFDGGFLVCGIPDGQHLGVLKLGDGGELEWTYILNTGVFGLGIRLVRDENAGFICVGNGRAIAEHDQDVLAAKLILVEDAVDYRSVPLSARLVRCYPNPFNSSTTIELFLDAPQQTSVKVYDVLGKEVASLIDKNMSRGKHSIRYEPNLPSGAYYVSVSMPHQQQTTRFILMR